MAKRELDLDDVIGFVKTLPYNQFKDVVSHYSSHIKTNFNTDLDIMTTLDFEGRLKALGINSDCPNCNSFKTKRMVKEIIFKYISVMNVKLNILCFLILYLKKLSIIGIYELLFFI